MRRAALVALMLSVAPVAGVNIDAEPALGAAPKWSITPGPTPPVAAANLLNAVSCVSADNCFAVGSSRIGPGQKVLIEHWNGNNWSLMSAPSKGKVSVLSDVSCGRASRCVAVGYFRAADGRYKPLIEAWNGSKWSIMPAPIPVGALAGVACPNTDSCFAVGYSETNAARTSLVQHWNGKKWSIMTVPNPAGTRCASLAAVSCPTRTNCFAVGHFGISGAHRALVEYWDGSTWKIHPVRIPTNARISALAGVSCTSAKHCFAVGRQVGSPVARPLIERWNGRQWSIVTSPKPGGGSSAAPQLMSLLGVTCTSTSKCVAVGFSLQNVSTKTLAEHWDGSRWKIQPSPTPSPPGLAYLARVSCPSATKCFAVGQANGTLRARYG